MKTVIRLTENTSTDLKPGNILMWDPENPSGETPTIHVGNVTLIDSITVNSNGTYDAPEGSAYKQVIVDVPTSDPYGQITEWEGERVYDTFLSANELNWVNKTGALLWKRDSDNKLVADNAGATRYWDPKGAPENPFNPPAKTGHTLIGVNVGLGKWAVVGYNGLSATKLWAATGDPVEAKVITKATHGNGYDATEAILKEYSNASVMPSVDTVWSLLLQLRTTYPTAFIASKYELIDITEKCCDEDEGHIGYHKFTKNISQLLLLSNDAERLSSSQDPGNMKNFFYVPFNNGRALATQKTRLPYQSIALFHFE